MMYSSPSVRSQPIVLSSSTEARVYLLFALAMGVTVAGIYAGLVFAATLFTSGLHWLLLIGEFAILMTAGLWQERSPLNYVLFLCFPFLSGLSLTPYILYLLGSLTNGGLILLNACAVTATVSLAAAVFARTTSVNLASLGGALFFGLIGLLVLGLLQIFIPALRGGTMELFLSGAGVLLFSGFIAYDLQRIQQLSRLSVSPFMLALSLYLDIFNLLLSVIRLMVALYGDRR